MKVKHWQDTVNLVLGAWLVASPWVLAYQAQQQPTWNHVVVGILVAALALYAMFEAAAWQELLSSAFGLWLIASPWALGFAGIQDAMLSSVIVGAAVLVLALWVLGTDKDLGGWWSAAH